MINADDIGRHMASLFEDKTCFYLDYNTNDNGEIILLFYYRNLKFHNIAKDGTSALRKVAKQIRDWYSGNIVSKIYGLRFEFRNKGYFNVILYSLT